jgi:hypothetical protein
MLVEGKYGKKDSKSVEHYNNEVLQEQIFLLAFCEFSRVLN